jgi:hypothetical protein
MRAQLLERARQQIALEQTRDVEALYDMIDPEIRARRESERTDEPDQTLSAIAKFVGGVRSATIEHLAIRELTTRRDGTPAGVVEVGVLYNGRPPIGQFRTVWYQRDGVWYTTALNKLVGGEEAFQLPPDGVPGHAQR